MLALINGRLITVSGEVLDKGSILVENGVIQKVGTDIEVPSDAEVVDVTGKYIMPGMVDAHCHAGVFPDGVSGWWEKGDGNELTDPITPHLRAIDAIHPEDMAFRDIREAGVTTINTGPGSTNIIGGQTAILKTYGKTVDEMVVSSPAAMKMALGENPKVAYGEQKRMPSTRMGNAGMLREWLIDAKDYICRWELYTARTGEHQANKAQKDKVPEPPRRDLRLESLALVLENKISAHIHAHRADDIMTALRIAEEFDFKVVLIHATEGYKIADILAEKGVPCVVGPIFYSRIKYELRGMNPVNPAVLSRAGVKVAIQTDQMSATKYITFDAALAVREGMDEQEALKAITIYPAEILGVADRLGSLEQGKDADIVIMNGHPLDVRNSKVEKVFMDGNEVYNMKHSSK